ncbi:MAG: hypothetical protein LBK95_21535 [Bifidobacteriaceae bacterium]|nr:hypothetical protein [Bifidobacteriaceae bacterium]
MHFIAKVTLWVAMVFCIVVSGQVFSSIDEAQPAGTRTAFRVVEVDAQSKQAAIAAIEEAARSTGTNIFKIQPEPTNSMQGRILFSFIGDPVAFGRHGGDEYPDFFHGSSSTRVEPGTDITTEDLRGRYVSSGDRSREPEVLAALENAGLTVEKDTVPAVGLLAYAMAQGNLAGALVVVIVALGLAVAYSVSSNRRAHALKALHGYRRAGIAGAELAAAASAFGGGLIGVILVGTPVLGVYNHFRQVWRFVTILGVGLVGLGLFVACLTIVLTAGSGHIADARAVLKGEGTPVREGLFAATAQVVVLAVVFGTTSGTMNRIEGIGRSLEEASRWTQGDPLYALRLTLQRRHDDDVRDAPGLRTVIAQMERNGQVLLAGYKGQWGDDSLEPESPGGSNAMVVNPKYLDVETVNDSQGHRIGGDSEAASDDENVFALLVPQTYRGDHQDLLQEYTESFRSLCEEWGEDPGPGCDPSGRIISTAPNQDLFTFNGTTFGRVEDQAPTYLHDPVVAVVSTSSGLLSAGEYLSYTSMDDVLFLDPKVLNGALISEGVRGSFMGIDNAADAVTYATDLSRRALRLDSFGLVLGGAVLLLAALVMAAVYCDRRRRPMFVETIHGYGFVARHRWFLPVTLCLSGLAVGLTATLAHMERERDLVAAVTLIVVEAGVTVAALRAHESRFRADFVKRT